MESLRARLEALLEKEMEMGNGVMNSNSPLLSQDLEMFYIETPAKLRNTVPMMQNQGREVIGGEKNCEQGTRNTVKQQFPCVFTDPTPLRFISDSPLVTPLRFYR
jgi:hypothetical protein